MIFKKIYNTSFQAGAQSVKIDCSKHEVNNNESLAFGAPIDANGTSESCIDLFLFSTAATFNIRNISTLCTLDNPLNFSAHDVVAASIEILKIDEPKETAEFSGTYSKFNQKRIIWDTKKMNDYQSMSSDFLSKCNEMFPNPEFIPLKCSMYSN